MRVSTAFKAMLQGTVCNDDFHCNKINARCITRNNLSTIRVFALQVFEADFKTRNVKIAKNIVGAPTVALKIVVANRST